MKINIFADLMDGPWGGGNQFIKGLRGEFIELGCYEPDPQKADVILLNSHNRLIKAAELKYRLPNKHFAHRLDGPIHLGRKYGLELDKYIFLHNEVISNGTFFQSPFSRQECLLAGMKTPAIEATIINGVDPKIFYPPQAKKRFGKKVKLIAASWSSNFKKGFRILQYLDKNLDFSRYEMTFVGNSPVEFENICYLHPVPSRELADMHRQYDIFIAASEVDPCSNALVEALSCGLPAVAKNSGGHPYIIGKAGELFENENDVLNVIDKVASNLIYYKEKITTVTLNQVAQKYIDIFEMILQSEPKTISLPSLSYLTLKGWFLKFRRIL